MTPPVSQVASGAPDPIKLGVRKMGGNLGSVGTHETAHYAISHGAGVRFRTNCAIPEGRWKSSGEQTRGARAAISFFGRGSYGGLLVADTCPISHGGPNGIRAVVGLDLSFAIRGRAIRH